MGSNVDAGVDVLGVLEAPPVVVPVLEPVVPKRFNETFGRLVNGSIVSASGAVGVVKSVGVCELDRLLKSVIVPSGEVHVCVLGS